MADALLGGIFSAVGKVIGGILGAVSTTALDKIFKKSKKDKNTVEKEFEKIIDDIIKDTFNNCTTNINIEKINNGKFLKRIYDLGFDSDTLNTLINKIKEKFNEKEFKTTIIKDLSSVSEIDKKIKEKNNELKKLEELQRKLGELQRKLEELKILENLKNLGDFEKPNTGKNTEIQKLITEYDEIQKLITAYNDEIQKLTGKNTEIQKLTGKNTEIQKSITEYNTEIQNLITKYDSEIQNLKDTDEKEKNKRQNLHVTLNTKVNDEKTKKEKIITKLQNERIQIREKEKTEKEKEITKIKDEIQKLETKKTNLNNLTTNCKTNITPVPEFDYEKVIFYIEIRLNALKDNYKQYYVDEIDKLKGIINDCDKIDIDEFCNKPTEITNKKATECKDVYNINKNTLNEASSTKLKEIENVYELYCKKDEFKKNKLITEIKKHLENVIKNYKSISDECKDTKCILSLILNKNYENEFQQFNLYFHGEFRGNSYKEVTDEIRQLLTYNLNPPLNETSEVDNFFKNNSIKSYNLEQKKYTTVLQIHNLTKLWNIETENLLKKIKQAKTLKDKEQKDKEQNEKTLKEKEQMKIEEKKKEEQKRLEREKARQEDSEREKKIIEQRERENKEQREKEKRIVEERARQNEHDKYIESIKNPSSSSSSSVSTDTSSKGNAIGILAFTASAVLLGGIGVAFASKK